MAFTYSLISRADFLKAAERLGVSLAVIKAVAAVEGRGSGFINGTDLPKILFEGHHFSRLTGGVFDHKAPSISYPKWTTKNYRNETGEYARLKTAIELNHNVPDPALQSASWGMFQIMGFNHRDAGYSTVTEFVDWMSMGEDYHLEAFVSFIEAKKLGDELRSGKWADFALRYNGRDYAKNKYDTKLAQEFRKHSMIAQEEAGKGTFALERGDLAGLQAALNIAIDAGLATDGWIGPKTQTAIRKFQSSNGMPQTGEIDAALCAALDVDCSHYLNTVGA
ncbi:N-acetylmuramidase domain-containing protein [Pseudoruegeria sp. SK021]|uniref:N-acetylmuramidase domain-containing protein n=1 Tax=Pseudoruegeria sp. SK021 TaxID=1933035 RepID=UPI000A261C27|nr:N-acetylmuramidase domain-containing protein [Pseudoruegeria sp. SK021]OSP56718.1 hypothetical protein BV911_01855 [Pseudoruegeria sp. SK021]